MKYKLNICDRLEQALLWLSFDFLQMCKLRQDCLLFPQSHISSNMKYREIY